MLSLSLGRLLGLTTQQDVDLLFNPVFVVRLVGLCVRSVHKAAQICQVVDEVKELTDVVSDGRTVGVHPLQMLLVHFANTFHAFIDRLIISVRASLGSLGRLDKQDGV